MRNVKTFDTRIGSDISDVSLARLGGVIRVGFHSELIILLSVEVVKLDCTDCLLRDSAFLFQGVLL